MHQVKMFSSDDTRWKALTERDPEAEGHFIYCVKTTMICCRPTCSSRLALRKNITFFDTLKEAMDAGYRVCKRCKPEDEAWNVQRKAVIEACQFLTKLAKSGKAWVPIDLIAKNVGLSKWHFLRVFKRYTKITPRSYFLKIANGESLESKELPIMVTKKSAKLESSESSTPKSCINNKDFSYGSSPETILTAEHLLYDSSVFEYDNFQNLSLLGDTGPSPNIFESLKMDNIDESFIKMHNIDDSLINIKDYDTMLQELFPELEAPLIGV